MADKNFNWISGTTNVTEIISSLVIGLSLKSANNPNSNNKAENTWDLVYPDSHDKIEDMAIISTEPVFYNKRGEEVKGKKIYLKFERPVIETNENSSKALNHILLTFSQYINSENNDLDYDKKCSIPARFSWYREKAELYDWCAVQYWISFSRNFINIVVQGDPGMDTAPYNNYLISYAYIGTLESFEDADDDIDYNFGITVSSDKFYDEDNMPDKYGKRTATCITDIGMLGTRTGSPFQAHLPKFSTAWEYADKNFITSSQWTHKHHMSEITVWHAYDRERGKLQNVLIGDRSTIFHLDELIIDSGKETEKKYVMFNINAPYSILNNGPNALYGIALRRE